MAPVRMGVHSSNVLITNARPQRRFWNFRPKRPEGSSLPVPPWFSTSAHWNVPRRRYSMPPPVPGTPCTGLMLISTKEVSAPPPAGDGKSRPRALAALPGWPRPPILPPLSPTPLKEGMPAAWPSLPDTCYQDCRGLRNQPPAPCHGSPGAQSTRA